ncbi:MAG: signal peptidase I [Peptostreptococcaceae bacterium]|nr:signal peptidase I [Peptostreptococcaceae bacterium]
MSKEKKKEIFTFIIQLIVVFVLVTLVKTFLVANIMVRQSSMRNTFLDGDVLLLSKLNKDDITRGDIIVFRNPDRTSDHKYFIKRVIGVEGDSIYILDDNRVLLNGELLDEDYVSPENNTNSFPGEWDVPENSIFVMGDNRDNSNDSRAFGSIPRSDILGKIFFRVYPFSKFGGVE